VDNHFRDFEPEKAVLRYRRHLPHWEQTGATYFITFRTADSLPAEVLEELRGQRRLWVQTHPRPWSTGELGLYSLTIFDKLDTGLDRGFGACPFKEPGSSEIVAQALLHFDGARYFLDEYVVMPNHVHAIVMPRETHPLNGILHSWKSYSANEVNRFLNKEGQLWMQESYDRIIRTWEDLEAVREYIRNNPRRARLGQSKSTMGRGIGIVRG